MGQLLLKELCLVLLYLFDVLGLVELYQFYCALLDEFGVGGRRESPIARRKVDSVRPYR